MKTKLFQTLTILLFVNGIVAQNYTQPKNDTKERFYENAKKAGMTETKTEELLKIIDDRNKVLKDLDTKKKQADAPYSIQDPGTLYNFKINSARTYYAKKISTLLTYKEYAEFTADDYKKEANENAKIEYEQLINNNTTLTEKQRKELYLLIYNYHLNQFLTTAYYSFDKTEQKPKLGILRFTFEKEFKKRCKEYNIKIQAPSGENTNGFEWN
ncbi:hypothetical protein HYN56_08710 [Flavobacterium crocinum]|uniref:DUF3826 domain-containing protein n=1 Tax=Flavobacterium crocinum TaxID=2183896 RepID=A0A2S1YJV6_9FLAO|nr:hypothetical protein [Flavobacterium crocinum]AWK04312.1 hypothetical protein HYN56_08710 [Flavobacterium crocinum]